MIKALIFDFDGVILDTEGPEYQTWKEIFAENGCDLPLSVWATGLGNSVDAFDPYNYLETQIGREIERELIKVKHLERYNALEEGLKVLPGVQNYFETAKILGFKLGVASSSSRKWVYEHLEALNIINYFDSIKCAADVKNVKPDPELYLASLEALGVEAAEAIAFEDSPNGITAALQAGIFCVAVPNPLTCQLPIEHANHRVPSLAAVSLETLLDRFKAK